MFLVIAYAFFFYKIKEQEGRTGWGSGTSERGEVAEKGVGG
jgi:hypothetical protein